MLSRVLSLIVCFTTLAPLAGTASAVGAELGGRGSTGLPVSIASGTPIDNKKNDVWSFTTEPQMRVEIEKYLKNPRASYFIIMRAQRHNLGPAAATVYLEWRKNRVGDPYIESAYAFSQWMAVGDLARNYLTQDVQPLIQTLRDQQMEAQYYRTEAIKARPNSPVVILETALPNFFSMGMTYAETTKNK